MSRPLSLAATSATRQCEHAALRRWRPSTFAYTAIHEPQYPSSQTRSRQAKTRPFSSSLRCQRGLTAVKPVLKQKAQASVPLKMEKTKADAMRTGNIPDDFGLLPDTFVMPRGANRPSWFGNFRARWRLERKRLRTRLTEVASALAYRYFMVRPRPRLHIQRIPAIAKELHKDMYTAFAAGNLEPVADRLLSGMAGSLKKRIALRQPNTALRWTVHKYLSAPRLVSYKPSLLPTPKGEKYAQTGLVQAVVRIHSLQSLQHVKRVPVRDPNSKTVRMKEVLVDSEGKELPDEALAEPDQILKNAKESVEYLVVQKNLKNAKETRWRVWGTVEETTLEKMLKDEKKLKAERLAAAKAYTQ